MASPISAKPSYPFIFVPILAAVLLFVVGFAAVYTSAILQAVGDDPQTVAGAAQIADTATPAEQYVSVTSGANPLSPSETPQKLPEGLPQNQPAGSPATAGGDYPPTNVTP